MTTISFYQSIYMAITLIFFVAIGIELESAKKDFSLSGNRAFNVVINFAFLSVVSTVVAGLVYAWVLVFNYIKSL